MDSIACELRGPKSATGLVLRAGFYKEPFILDEGTDFDVFSALVGFRHHWGIGFGEVDAGVGEAVDRWRYWRTPLPQLEAVLGVKLGDGEIGVWANVPFVSFGIRVGGAIDLGG
ncbi:MAG: hypothetical protein QM831_03940 [Kofleriaceae bacterium]